MTMTLDLRRDLKHLYLASAKTPAVVEVPLMRFLAIDGAGQPGAEAFQNALQALFTLAYSVRFAAKKQLGLEYPVMALEGVYWNADGGPLGPDDPPEKLAWTLQIMLPEQVPDGFVEQTRAEAATKGKGGPRLADVALRRCDEGTCVQFMHVGPYDAEAASIQRLTDFATEHGYEISGPHHGDLHRRSETLRAREAQDDAATRRTESRHVATVHGRKTGLYT